MVFESGIGLQDGEPFVFSFFQRTGTLYRDSARLAVFGLSLTTPFAEGCPGVNDKASPPGRHQEQTPKQRCTFRPTAFSSVQSPQKPQKFLKPPAARAQFSSVQFSSVQFSSVHCRAD